MVLSASASVVLRYTLRRIMVAVPMLLGLSVITFALANFMPGYVVDYMMNPADALSGEVL